MRVPHVLLVAMLSACASGGQADRLRQIYLQSGVRAEADIDCAELSQAQCDCFVEQHSALQDEPDDQSLLEAERLVEAITLSRVGGGGVSDMMFAVTVAPVLIDRAKQRCGIDGDLSDAWDDTGALVLDPVDAARSEATEDR